MYYIIFLQLFSLWFVSSSTFYTVLDGITRELWITSILRGTGQLISFLLVSPLFLTNLSIIKKEQLTLLNSAIFSALLGVVGVSIFKILTVQ